MVTSPVLHQVELLEALLNYYIINNLYPEVNGKNHCQVFQVKSGHCFLREREVDLELGNRPFLQVVRPWASHFSQLQWPVVRWECGSQPHLPPGLNEGWGLGQLFGAQESSSKEKEVASERLRTKLIQRAQGSPPLNSHFQVNCQLTCQKNKA